MNPILVNVITSFATSLHRAKSFWAREVSPHQETGKYSATGGESVIVPDGIKTVYELQFAGSRDAKKLVSEKMKLTREYAGILNAAVLLAGESGETVKTLHAELAKVEEERLAKVKAEAEARAKMEAEAAKLNASKDKTPAGK